MDKWVIKDPWRTRLREWLARHAICPIIGHDEVVKMDGTRLCRRH